MVCLAVEPVMFAIEGAEVEQKSLNIDIQDRPSLISVSGLAGQKAVGSCMKMVNGNVVFVTAEETAEISSSSSESSLSPL